MATDDGQKDSGLASETEAPNFLAEGFGLSSWMASPAEMEAAAMAAAGEPVASGDGGAGSSWKRWAGRRGGKQGYQFGDLTRGLFSGAATSVADSVREVRHNAANAQLKLKETVEQTAREQVSSLLSKDGEGEAVETGSIPLSERWWYEACRNAHRDHDPQDDAPRWHDGSGSSSGSASRGHLEVRFLSASVPNGKLPVCQLSLDGCQSGGLRPQQPPGDGVHADDREDRPLVSLARFVVQEVAGCDLRVNVFEGDSATFKLGFEHNAFYGGSFLPLSLIMGQGERCSPDAAQPLSAAWEAAFNLNLFPLELVRLKTKLEPARPGSLQRPEKALGFVKLGVKLVLRAEPSWATPVVLRVEEPFLGTQQQASFVNVSEPLTLIREAGATLERCGRALVFDPHACLLEELKQKPAFAAVLHVWWLYLSLLAPVWAWPPLLAAVLPLYSLSLKAALGWPLGLQAPCLFDDPEGRAAVERKDSSKKLAEKVQGAMHDAAQSHANLRAFFQKLSSAAATLEKVKFVLAVGDPCTSLICMVALLAAACLASVAIVVLGCFCSIGGLRLVLWGAGSYALLPASVRAAVGQYVDHLQELKNKYTGDELERRLRAFWARVPDSVEAAHLELCRLEALRSAP